MPLSTGDKLGPHEIVAPIGAGGTAALDLADMQGNPDLHAFADERHERGQADGAR